MSVDGALPGAPWLQAAVEGVGHGSGAPGFARAPVGVAASGRGGQAPQARQAQDLLAVHGRAGAREGVGDVARALAEPEGGHGPFDRQAVLEVASGASFACGRGGVPVVVAAPGHAQRPARGRDVGPVVLMSEAVDQGEAVRLACLVRREAVAAGRRAKRF